MKLIDVCELIVDCPHSTAKDEGQGIPLVRTPNIGKGRLEFAGIHRVSETIYNLRIERATPKAGDLILAREAPVGNVALIMPGQKVCLGQRVVLIRPNQIKADSAYLTYYLLSKDVQHRLKNNANGAVVAHLNMDDIRNLEIELPDISVQKRIAGVLSCLDDKIALNNRINHNLEEQAQALYKSWFVDFEPFKDGKFVDSELGMIPEGWSVKSLGEVTKEMRDKVGTRQDVKVLSPVTSGHLVLSEEFFTKQVFSESIAKYLLVKPGDFAYNPARVNIGSLGLNEYSFDGCVSPVYVVFRCEKRYNHFFDIYRTTAPFKDEVLSRSSGGVRQTLGYKDFALIRLVYPPKEVVDSFNSLYEGLLAMKKSYKKENDLLSLQRDSLLPLLLSGEISCGDLNC